MASSSASEDAASVPLTEADVNFHNPDGPPVYRLVFTGGPCGGKTTALARVFSFLRERGFEAVMCPEAYTLLSSNGMQPHLFGTEGMATYIQRAVLETQLTLEDCVAKVLKARGQPGVILCDRGLMDGTVYMPLTEFSTLLAERSLTVVDARDTRYDAVFHLVTAADGAVHAYTLENNSVRTETPAEAIEVDRKTQAAWVGHPRMYILDNSTDFEGKMKRLVNHVAHIVGLPTNLQRRAAKFLLTTPATQDWSTVFPTDLHYQVFDVEKVYVQQTNDAVVEETNNYRFIRKRTLIQVNGDTNHSSHHRNDGTYGGSVYQLTTVQVTDTGETIEQKRIISKREYATAFASRDPTRNIVRQRRVSFLYEKQSFTIHAYQEPIDNLCILHAQVVENETTMANSEEVAVQLPPFLQVQRRLTKTPQDEEKYGAYSISLLGRPPSIRQLSGSLLAALS